MADNKTTIEVSIQAAEAAKTIQELKKSLKDLVNQQANVAAGSAEWKKLTNAINETEGKIGDLTDSFKTLQGSGVDRVSSSFNLFKEGLSSFDFGKIGTSLRGLGAAFKAIPIFLIAEGIAYLQEKFDIFGIAIEFITSIFYKLTDAMGITNKKAEEQTKVFLESQEKQKKSITDRYDAEIAIAKAAGKTTNDLELNKLKKLQETISSQILELDKLALKKKELNEDELKQYNELQDQLLNATTQRAVKEAEILKEQREKIKELYKVEENAFKKLNNLKLSDRQREIQSIKDAADEELKTLEKNYIFRDGSGKQIEANEKRFAAAKVAIEEAAQIEIAKINKKYNDELKKNKFNQWEFDMWMLSQQLKNAEELSKKEAENAIKNKELQALEEIEIEESKNTTILDFEKLKNDAIRAEGIKNLQEFKANTDAQLTVAQQGTQSLQNLSDIYFTFKMRNLKKGSAEEEKAARQQFKINKALQLTGAIIDGAKAITSSLAQAPVAIGPIPNPAGIASLALAITSSVASIAKIAATKYEGGANGGGGGSISAPSPSIPSAPTVSTPTNNISGTQFDAQGNTITPQAQQPTITVKAQVVESDMTDTQNTVTKYKAQSTF